MRITLALKMTVAVLVAAFLLASFWWFVVRPDTERALARGTAPLVQQGVDAMRAEAHTVSRAVGDALTTVIRHGVAARRAAFTDLPLELHDGNPARMVDAISRHDSAMSQRLVANVDVLAREMEARGQRRIDASAATLATMQQASIADLARGIRNSSLLLLGSAAACLVLLLAWGLRRLVLRPVDDLGRAARAVANGDLHVDLDARGGDEMAELVRSFVAMVGEMRASRRALADLNGRLESDVVAKTAQLQQALDGLRAAQRDLVLAERMASVGTLAGGIAHEFNNLAGGIRGCAREMLAAEADGNRRDGLAVIERAATRALQVTDKLLRFARPAAAGDAIVDLSQLLRDAVTLVEPQARQQEVAVGTEIAADLRVRGDESALHQVFVNLLGNALQAMPGGGSLTVGLQAANDDAVVTVRDTGVGIDAARIDRIFDPFYSTREREQATPGHGTGLGLAVSFGIVHAHRGRWHVESEPGRGSTFTVHLPLERTTP